MRLPNQKDSGAPLSELEIAQAIAADAKLEHVRIDTLSLNADLIESKMSRPFARRHRMIPLDMVNGRLRLACANPYDIEGIDSFRRIAGRDIELVVAAEPELLKALTEFYRPAPLRQEGRAGSDQVRHRPRQPRAARADEGEHEIEASDQHIVNAVEFMLQYAFDQRASDIHIEPKRDSLLIRFRIDGVLHDIQTHSRSWSTRPIVSRIKTLSRMDIAEKRRPQDGRIKTDHEGQGGRAARLHPAGRLRREGGDADLRSRRS